MRADTEKLAGSITAAYGFDPQGGIDLNPVLEIKNLNYVYSIGTPFEHKALDNVSFAVNRGEFIGIIGHTGSGKSTLVRLFNGLERPTSGTVLLDGADIWTEPKNIGKIRFRVGFVMQ